MYFKLLDLTQAALTFLFLSLIKGPNLVQSVTVVKTRCMPCLRVAGQFLNITGEILGVDH